MDPAALLADLDDDQRRAVTTESGLVAVIAGAGSGKTRVLTRRIAHRIATESADARHTVALTFTREAAGELGRRLVQLGLTEQITAGTFHSVANQLLRQRWADRDESPWTIVNDRGRIVRGLDVAGGISRGDVDTLVEEMAAAAARGWSPAAFVSAARRGEVRSMFDPQLVGDAMAAYRSEKRRRRLADLDDLLVLTIEALEHDTTFADLVHWRFRHVYVDEAQDLNPLQHRLVELVRGDHDDVFLVGDPAQAIYGFTGSDPSLLVDVGDRFPGCEVIRLPVNHRSTPQVVDAGRHVLGHADVGTTIESARTDGQLPTVQRHDDEHTEAAAVATAVALADPDLIRSGRVAVLARTHATLERTRAALAVAGVAVRRRAAGRGSNLAGLLDEAYRLGEPDQLRRWIRDQHEAANEADGDSATDAEVRREVALAANEFLRHHPTGNGAALRGWVTATDPFGTAEPGVELLTFHGAKGREWHTVHLIGCETSLVPHRSAGTTARRDEEARLFYVAVTRATDALHVHWAERRAGYRRKLTPFLDDYAATESPAAPPPPEFATVPADTRDARIERLREWRASVARRSDILPDEVIPDRMLTTIAEQQPSTPEELDAITGLGTLTSRKLFDGIFTALG